MSLGSLRNETAHFTNLLSIWFMWNGVIWLLFQILLISMTWMRTSSFSFELSSTGLVSVFLILWAFIYRHLNKVLECKDSKSAYVLLGVLFIFSSVFEVFTKGWNESIPNSAEIAHHLADAKLEGLRGLLQESLIFIFNHEERFLDLLDFVYPHLGAPMCLVASLLFFSVAARRKSPIN